MEASRSPSRLRLALLGLALCGPGCTVFSDYGGATEDGREAFMRGDFAAALQEYEDGLDATNDALLYHFECGGVAHVGQRYEESFGYLDRAWEMVDAYQSQALAEEAAQIVGSILVNEKTLSYTGHVFEQILMQGYNARNAFLDGDRDTARIEVRRSYLIQDRAKEIYRKELTAAEDEARAKGTEVDVAGVQQELHEAYDYGDLAAAEDVYNINYIRYLNAWIREVTAYDDADYNDAWLDLKYVASRFEDVQFIQRDLIRMAERLGARQRARAWRQKYGLDPLPEDYGSVALFFESGMAPALEEISVYFPTYKGVAKAAIPKYTPQPDPVSHALIELGDYSQPTTTLSNVDAIAFRYHQDRMPLIIAKMVIRLAVKIGVQSGGTAAIEQSTKGTKNEGLGQLIALGFSAAASAWNVLSEQADLRCWRTLPKTLQATRLWVPAGDYPARLVLVGHGGSRVATYDLGTVRVQAGRHRMVNARSVGRRVFADVRREPYDGGAAARDEVVAGNGAGAETTTTDVLTGEQR